MVTKTVGLFSTLANSLFALAALSLITLSTLPAAAAQSGHRALHRLDFRIHGASCVVCLRHIGSALRRSPGVVKAEVSILKPYWSIVIYDAEQTSLSKLNAAIKNEHVQLLDIQDSAIAVVPVVVIPKNPGVPLNR